MAPLGWQRRPRRCSLICALHTLVCVIILAQGISAGLTQAGATEISDRATPESAGAMTDAELVESQRILAEKYARFELVLMRMAEVNEATDPRRAALLRRVLSESKGRLVEVQFDALVELLRQKQLARAIENQEALDADLGVLLGLLESESRADQLQAEKERIREYLKELGNILRNQKGLQGRTQGAVESERLAGEQGDIAREAGRLSEKIDANETRSDQPARSDTGSSDGSARDGDGATDRGNGGGEGGGGVEGSQSGEPSDGSSSGRSAGDPAAESGSSSDDASGDGGAGDPSSGQPSGPPSSGPSAGSRSQESRGHPAADRLREAQQAMRKAQERLKQAEAEGAVESQEEAIRRLEEARAVLEEILRQMREEEILQTLEILEVRFARMLAMQKQVLTDTQHLDRTAVEGRLSRAQEIESGQLSLVERKIIEEVDRALALLREEGSSVAFVESLGQTRGDMIEVAGRLADADVGTLTQAVQEDIITSLQEMLTALEKAMREAEERRNQPASNSMPQDPPLIDLLSELKLIRSLQIRVNDRTDRYAKLIAGEQAEKPDLLQALQELSKRQARIHEILRALDEKMGQ